MAAAAPAALAIMALGQVQQGFAENSQQRRMATMDEENGRLALLAGEQQAYDVQRQGVFETGAAAADMAGSGLVFGGSIATVLANSAEQVALDIDRVRERARGEAINKYAQARERRRAGKQAIIGGMFGALATAVGGAADIRRQNRLDQQAGRERQTRLGGMG